MDKAQNDIKIRIESLRNELDNHRYNYHVLDKPVISDEVYDSMMTELVKLEKEYPEYDSDSSPSKRVGGEILDSFKKVTHEYKQWSFDNVFNFEELQNWEDRNNKILVKENLDTKYSYICELKIDGLKVILDYRDGNLFRAATRGDGAVGEDVTHNIKTIKTIPLILKEKVDIVIIGECWMKQSDLEKINKKLTEEGVDTYANTRNLSAGTLRQLDSSVAAKRNLQFFAYDIEGGDDILEKLNLKSQDGELNFLRENKFLVNDETVLCKDLSSVEDLYKKYSLKKEREYGVDGLVIKINERNVWNTLGYTSKSPRGGIAYKFPAEESTSVVLDIVCQVGRTGAITPVACLTPTLIAGSTVSRATLHNYDEIVRLGVRVGDTVMLRKAGDVIPEIFEVIESLRPKDTKVFIMPTNCPVCDSVLIKEKDKKEIESVALFCKNPDCEAKHLENLIHFVSKKGMNIDGLGEKIIYEFYELGLISDYTSIYKLAIGDIENLFGFGKKSAENIIESINNSREVKMSNFIYALGIRHVGETTARDISKYFDSLEEIKSESLENLKNIEGVGVIVAESVYEYFNNKKNLEILKELEKEIKIISIKSKIKLENRKLENKTFVITGTLSQSRDYYKDLILENGGKVSGSVSAKTDYLLAGENAGSKYDDAKKLNVITIGEQELLNMIV